MRVRRYDFSGYLLGQMWTQDESMSYRITKGLPTNARIVHIKYTRYMDIVSIYVEHESFDDVGEGGKLPIHAITVQTVT